MSITTHLSEESFSLVAEYLHHWASLQPNHIAFYYREQEITYGEFEQRAEKLACYLLSQEIKKGDRILYMLNGSPEFFYLYMAAAMIGAVVVGAGLRFPAPEISRVLEDAEPVLIFCHGSAVTRLATANVKKIPVIVVDGSNAEDTKSIEKCFPNPSQRIISLLRRREDEVETNDPLFILYTSGTTGTPKGSVLTHRNVIASARAQSKTFGAPEGCSPDDIFQHQVPVDHVSGAVEWGVTPIVVGCASILAEGFEPRHILENTQRYRATILAGVPTMWNMMFSLPDFGRYDLSSVRWCMSGASTPPQAMLERILRICPNCANPLGLTETSGFCTYTAVGATAVELAESVGRIIPTLSYKIVDENRQLVEKGQVGQLAYKGPSVIRSYYKNENETNAVIDVEGYLYSGDLACEISDGNILLRGRNDEMFITAGYNVYPIEIESVLLNYPGVRIAAVLPVPDAVMGMVGRAYVVPEPGVNFTKQEIRHYLSNELAGYKIPRSYVLTEKVPLTALGKPQKTVIAKEIDLEFNWNR